MYPREPAFILFDKRPRRGIIYLNKLIIEYFLWRKYLGIIAGALVSRLLVSIFISNGGL